MSHQARRKVKVSKIGEALGIIRGTTFTFNYWSDTKGEPCPYCGAPGLTKEHVIPQSEGGSDGAWNVVWACLGCNQRRGSMPLLRYLIERKCGISSDSRQDQD